MLYCYVRDQSPVVSFESFEKQANMGQRGARLITACFAQGFYHCSEVRHLKTRLEVLLPVRKRAGNICVNNGSLSRVKVASSARGVSCESEPAGLTPEIEMTISFSEYCGAAPGTPVGGASASIRSFTAPRIKSRDSSSCGG